MAYWIARNNQKVGPYSLADVQSMLADGKILSTDLAWTEGMANWGPALQVIPAPAQPPEPPAPAMEPLPPTRILPAMRTPDAPQQPAAAAPQPAPQPVPQPAAAQAFQPAPQPAQPVYRPAPMAAQPAQPIPQPAAPFSAASQAAAPPQGQTPIQQPFQPAPQYTPAPQQPQPSPAYMAQPAPQPQHPYAPPPPATPAGPYQPYGAPPAAQPMQPMQGPPVGFQQAGQSFNQAGQAFNQAFGAAGNMMGAPAAQGGPLVPPGMSWVVLLVLGVVTLGIFNLYWVFKQAGFVQRLDPSNPAKKLYTILVLVVVVYMLLVAGAAVTRSETLLGIVAATGSLVNIALVVLSLVAIFKMRSSLLNYYNTVEPIGLRLSGVMTLFFNIIYFQYHFHRIAQWKQTGMLTPQK